MPQLLADIDTYLDGIGLKQYRNINQFWSYMDSRYSRTQVCELEKSYMKLERGDDEGFYSDIFQNLKTSLDFCSLRRDLYRSYLTWFLENMMPPTAVTVDAVCGNGILTCFYAKHFRESRVIGFDSSEQGIECAKELAQQVGCKNVEFVVSDFNKPSLPVEKGEVELITSVASLRSGSEMNGGISIYALLSQAKQSRQKSTIKALEPYLNPKSGCLISFDKVSNISQQISWASEIQAAGLGVDLRKSS